MAGMPLMVVARNLGHSDTRMVEKHYGHMAPSFITDAVRKSAPRFGFKPGNARLNRAGPRQRPPAAVLGARQGRQGRQQDGCRGPPRTE